MAAPQSLIEHFAKLEDPRVDRNKKHELIDVIVLCVCAVVSGANGWSDIEEFGRAKLEWLRRYVPLANGVPVDDTIARIVSALSVSGFQECFRSWVEDVVTLSEGEIVAVDGKTHRRSHDRKNGVKALHMVSAWASRNGVVLGQVKTQEKSNEITAVPELLKKLELKGCIVTVDAMGCQREVAQKVHEGGGDYVLAVKDNQEQLARELRGYFEAAQGEDFEWPEIENEETADEGHGRVEYRSYFLSTDLSHLSVGERWVGLKAIGMVESERHVESRAGAPTLGSGGDSGAFAPGLSPAPIVTFPAPALRTRRADFRHRALQWDHAPRTRTAETFRAGRSSDSADFAADAAQIPLYTPVSSPARRRACSRLGDIEPQRFDSFTYACDASGISALNAGTRHRHSRKPSSFRHRSSPEAPVG